MRMEKAVWGTSAKDDTATARLRLSALAEESGMAFEELLRLWADDTALQLAAASAALAAGNLADAARLVHGASGASGICGISALAEQLKMVEQLAVQGRSSDAQKALASAQVRFACLSGALQNAD